MFLPTDIATGGGITDERDADRRFPSVSPSVNNLTTNTESHTDGFNPSVKLLNLVVTIEVGCMIFGMKAKKKTREITISKAGTTWRFGGISNCYTSRDIYSHNMLSTRRLSGSHNAHSPVLATGTSKFMFR